MMRRIEAVSRQPSTVSQCSGFTLIEMLIAMAITLVMIGAVVTLFANISNSVRNRRAVVEMSGQLRHARNMLQQDLQGATCSGLTWQRPDENQGYIEIIEGPQREGNASVLVDGVDSPGSPQFNPEIDHRTSIIPSSNVPFTDPTWVTDGGSLGDHDDILMLTVRNEHEPFVGRVPKSDGSVGAVRTGTSNPNSFVGWEPNSISSPLAEVVWYAIENPDEQTNNDADRFFGEPGMRTIYRRALLIAPWLNPYRAVDNNGNFVDTFTFDGGNFTAQPGLLRILRNNIDNNANDRLQALAALVAFQEKYDISARLEWDPLMGSDGRWKIVANTLGDLTKRENRYEHHFFRHNGEREYPFAAASIGSDYSGTNVEVVVDPELSGASPFRAATANLVSTNNVVTSYTIEPNNLTDSNRRLPIRPFTYIAGNSTSLATARAMLNDEGQVVRVVHGLVPLSRERRGEDVILSDALGFDLRVYDPGAPLFAHSLTETVLEPTDPAWLNAYVHSDNTSGANSSIGRNNAASQLTFPFVGQGAYVDMGYGYNVLAPNLTPSWSVNLPAPQFANAFSSATIPWFFSARALSNVLGNQLAPGYAVYDTWSFHYENNGLDEDRDSLTDEGTNGFDDVGSYSDTSVNPRLGPDDVGERETTPPYDRPLRGVQVLLRLYERDSRQVKQVSVNQSFVPE